MKPSGGRPVSGRSDAISDALVCPAAAVARCCFMYSVTAYETHRLDSSPSSTDRGRRRLAGAFKRRQSRPGPGLPPADRDCGAAHLPYRRCLRFRIAPNPVVCSADHNVLRLAQIWRVTLVAAVMIGLATFTAFAQAPNTTSLDRPLRVFIDCRGPGCDQAFFRTELAWIDHVRDQMDADVHVLVTAQGTGGGGKNIRFASSVKAAGRDKRTPSHARPRPVAPTTTGGAHWSKPLVSGWRDLRRSRLSVCNCVLPRRPRSPLRSRQSPRPTGGTSGCSGPISIST